MFKINNDMINKFKHLDNYFPQLLDEKHEYLGKYD